MDLRVRLIHGRRYDPPHDLDLDLDPDLDLDLDGGCETGASQGNSVITVRYWP